MNYSSIDPSMSIALDDAQQSVLNILSSISPNTRIEIVANLIRQAALSNKKTLVLLPQTMTYDLERFKELPMLHIHSDAPITTEEISYIRYGIDQSVSKLSSPIAKKTNRLSKKIAEHFSTLKSIQYDNQSMPEIIWRPEAAAEAGMSKSLSRAMMNLSSLDIREHLIIREQIKNAAGQYRPEFEYLDKLNEFDTDQISFDKTAPVLDKLDAHGKSFIELRKSIKAIIAQIERKWQAEEQAGILNLLNQISEIRAFADTEVLKEETKRSSSSMFAFRKNPRKDSKSLLDQKLKQLSSGLNESILANKFDADALLNYTQDDDLMTYLETITHELEYTSKSLQIRMDERLKRLNIVNADSSFLRDFNHAMTLNLNALNDDNIFAKAIEDNTFNLIQKEQFLSYIINKVNQAKWLIANHGDYLVWTNWVSQQKPATQTLIKSLSTLDNDVWVSRLDQAWFSTLIVGKTKISRLTDVDLDHCAALHTQQLEQRIEAIREQLDKMRIQAVSEVQQYDPKLHHNLIKSKALIVENWLDILAAAPDLVRDVYPTVVMSEANFQQYGSYKNMAAWDQVILLDFDKFKEINLDKIKKIATQYFFISENEIEEPLVMQLKYLAKNERTNQASIYSSYINKGIAESLSPLKQKLNILQHLACNIAVVNPNVKIYQTKSHCFISFFNEPANDALHDILTGYNAKEFKLLSAGVQQLIDFLIQTDREVIILTQDELLNPVFSDYFIWQRSQIEQMIQVGFRQINIDTYEHSADPKSHLSYEIASLFPSQVPSYAAIELEIDPASKSMNLA